MWALLRQTGRADLIPATLSLSLEAAIDEEGLSLVSLLDAQQREFDSIRHSFLYSFQQSLPFFRFAESVRSGRGFIEAEEAVEWVFLEHHFRPDGIRYRQPTGRPLNPMRLPAPSFSPALHPEEILSAKRAEAWVVLLVSTVEKVSKVKK